MGTKPNKQSSSTEERVPLKADDVQLSLFYIMSPTHENFSYVQATGLLRALATRCSESVFELSLVGIREGVYWSLLIGDGGRITPEELTDLFNTYISGTVVARLPQREPEPRFRRFHIFKRNSVRYFDRSAVASEIGSDDALVHVARAISELEAGEIIKYTISVLEVSTLTDEEKTQLLSASAYGIGYRAALGRISTRNWAATIGSLFGAVGRKLYEDERLKKQILPIHSPTDEARFREKLDQALVTCFMSITFDSPDKNRLLSFERLFGAVEALSSEEVKIEQGYTSPILPINNFDDWYYKTAFMHIINVFMKNAASSELEHSKFRFTFDELGAHWHPPHVRFPREILYSSGFSAPVPRNLRMDTSGIKVGSNRMGSKSTEVYLPLSDRTSHLSISGKTGVGKSSFLHGMIDQDIAAGRGVLVFDPTGSLVSSVLQHSIPPERENDLLLLDINMTINGVFCPPPLNLFVAGLDDSQQESAAMRLTTAFARMDKDFTDKRMANTLNQGLLAASYVKNPTINDVYNLLFNAEYRERLIPRIRHDMVQAYWLDFDMMSDAQRQSLTDPLRWRLERLMLNSRLRSMLCHPQHLNFGQLISSNKIILVSLANNQSFYPQEEIELIGSALLMQLDYAARRKTVTKAPFMVYIDEAQQFVDMNLPDMLSQLRSCGVGLVLANQYLAQLLGETAKAVEGNVGTLISFEIGKSDARSLLPYFEPQFTDNALVSLGKFRAAISMRDEHGTRQPAFTLETFLPPGFGTSKLEREAYLRQLVVENWHFKPYDEIFKGIQERYAPNNLGWDDDENAGANDEHST